MFLRSTRHRVMLAFRLNYRAISMQHIQRLRELQSRSMARGATWRATTPRSKRRCEAGPNETQTLLWRPDFLAKKMPRRIAYPNGSCIGMPGRGSQKGAQHVSALYT